MVQDGSWRWGAMSSTSTGEGTRSDLSWRRVNLASVMLTVAYGFAVISINRPVCPYE